MDGSWHKANVTFT